MNRRDPRTDANQPEIKKALEDAGAFVQNLAGVGEGCPDLVCAYRGRWYMLEVKAEAGRLTKAQKHWHMQCGDRGPVYVVRSVDEALNVVGAVQYRA